MPDDDGFSRSASFDFRNIFRAHGVGIRGFDVLRRSDQFEGRFGRMFRTLPAADHNADDLKALAKAMTAGFDPPPDPDLDQADAEENSGIAAGYTYFGQFIDHDLTFDPASSLEKTNDPDGLVDFRTPRFDLDCVYGRGPDDQPYLYRNDGMHLLQGRDFTGNDDDKHTRDLPRNNAEPGDPKRALLGDPRNDENVIVSQFQGVMIRFHNRVVDHLQQNGGLPKFSDVQRFVRWHYQWAVVNDFLRTIVGEDNLFAVLPHVKSGKTVRQDPPKIHFFHWRNAPFMPIEFSAAAYRFGHSMVRPIYRLNRHIPRLPIFSTNGLDLRAFGEFPDNWAIEWKLFFHIDPKSPDTGPQRVQPAYKIDTSLVNPLGNLPASVAKDPSSLAERNLLRGKSMGLPSGQSVARAMGFTPIDDKNLFVGKATEEDQAKLEPLLKVSARFKNNAPLWYYVLAEAQQQFKKDSTPIHLGPVGGRIVTEVFAGLLMGDNHSYLAQDPTWQPFNEFMRDGKFGIAELILAATKN
jgi:hypothetical protein